MFGGSMFSAMDPLAMVALIHSLGEDYVVWDKSASIQYKRPANQHAKFTFEENWHTFGNKLKNVANASTAWPFHGPAPTGKLSFPW